MKGNARQGVQLRQARCRVGFMFGIHLSRKRHDPGRQSRQKILDLDSTYAIIGSLRTQGPTIASATPTVCAVMGVAPPRTCAESAVSEVLAAAALGAALE